MTTKKVNEKAMAYVNNGTKKLFIGGEWKKSSSGSTINVVNPATEEVITQIYAAEKEDIDLAVKSAKEAFESKDWTGMTPTERGTLDQDCGNHRRKYG